MKNIKEITKNTLQELNKKSLATTPENYFVEFKNQAVLSKATFEELELFELLKASLSENEHKNDNIDSFNKLALILAQRVSSKDLKNIIKALEEALKPSVNNDISKEITEFVNYLLDDPAKIIESETLFRLKNLAKQRVTKDRQVLEEKTADIIKLTSLMSRYFDKTLSKEDSSTEEIIKIKDELIDLDISKFSHNELRVVQQKLIDTIFRIEANLLENKKVLEANKERFNYLNSQIEELQKELILVREEKQTDFLTNLLNRRAFDEEIIKMDEKFEVLKSDYAIVFLDIDYFKEVNDKYGHSCGDAVLKNFAKILSNLTRKEDILARYGGEEFISLVHYEDEVEIERYLKRVKATIKDSNFIYKNSTIKISFSAGVSYREKYKSFTEAKNSADKLLYKAKNLGRDTIILDSDIRI